MTKACKAALAALTVCAVIPTTAQADSPSNLWEQTLGQTSMPSAVRFAVKGGTLDPVLKSVIEQQVAQFQQYWQVPSVGFSSTGTIPIILTSQTNVNLACNAVAGGCHHVQPNGWPIIYVAQYDPVNTGEIVDHEILETLVDPNMVGYEVCDPVQNHTYVVDGWVLADWVTPLYEAHPGLQGPPGRDFLNQAGNPNTTQTILTSTPPPHRRHKHRRHRGPIRVSVPRYSNNPQ